MKTQLPLKFTVVLFLALLAISLMPDPKSLPFPLQNINIISDLQPKKTKPKPKLITVKTPVIIVADSPGTKVNFSSYQLPKTIIGFDAFNNKPALAALAQKVYDLKKGKKRKIRIAYFGDSMIEADLMSQTLRKLLQKEYGGTGVGFIPITAVAAGMRQTAITSFSEGWQDINFKNANEHRLFLSGHLFKGSGYEHASFKDATISDSNALPIVKKIFYSQSCSKKAMLFNGEKRTLVHDDMFNSETCSLDTKRSISVAESGDTLSLYGVSFESETGIIVDNFSFRGITGIELAYINESLLKSVSKNNPYDLVILQYGVNMLYKPGDTDFKWYQRAFNNTVKKLKQAFDSTEFLLVSTADRAFRYEGEYHSATGIDSLILVQAQIANDNKLCFYNQFESMGGHDAIVEWATMKPSLANQDYVHPNARGAAILGTYLFEAIKKDIEKYKP